MIETDPTKRNIPLDGMRAVAVLFVFTAHAGPWAGGYLGVDMFFVLSGFLITGLLKREFDDSGNISFRNFYWRRSLRLLPALLLLLAVYLPFGLLFTKRATDHLWATINSFYVMNWVRAFNLGPQGFLGHTWSLAIEEQFYIIWPITLLLLLRLRNATALRSIIVSLIAAVIIWRGYLLYSGADLNRIYNGSDTHSEALLMGCLLAVTPYAYAFAARLWLPFAMLVAITFVQFQVDKNWMATGGFPLTAVAASCLIAALISPGNELLKSFLSIRPISLLGRISYGFYLWHYVIIIIIGTYVDSRIEVSAICFLATFVIAWLSFQLVEKPLLRYKNISFLRKKSVSLAGADDRDGALQRHAGGAAESLHDGRIALARSKLR